MTPSLTISWVPPTSVAMTGMPNPQASMIESGRPSLDETFTKTSKCFAAYSPKSASFGKAPANFAVECVSNEQAALASSSCGPSP